MLDKAAFLAWQDSPVTQYLFDLLRDRAEFFSDLVLDGMPGQDGQKLLLSIGEAIGRINAYNEIIDIHFEDISEAKEAEHDE